MSQRPIRGAEPKFSQLSNHYDVHMDALAPGAVGALLETFPGGSVVHAQCFTPETKAYFDALPGAERRDDDLYFTVTSEVFQPAEGENVVELTEADDRLFEGCEQKPDWEHAGEHSRAFAILADGRVASWAWSAAGGGPATPVGTVSPGMVCHNLYTQTRHRRRGLGRRLVSHITQLILQKGKVPIYWTEPDNIASQRLCKGLGYWQYGQLVFYTWSKPAGG
jgi:GNAT superfamily N-acetyltransferase